MSSSKYFQPQTLSYTVLLKTNYLNIFKNPLLFLLIHAFNFLSNSFIVVIDAHMSTWGNQSDGFEAALIWFLIGNWLNQSKLVKLSFLWNHLWSANISCLMKGDRTDHCYRSLSLWAELTGKTEESQQAGGGEEKDTLTWYLWNSNLFTAAAVSSITEWLNFYYVIFIKRQRKLHWCFICFNDRCAALSVPSVQDLPIQKEQVSPAVLTKAPKMEHPLFSPLGTSEMWAHRGGQAAHTPLGASFIVRGTSAGHAACGQRQHLSTNAPCGHTEPLEGSGNAPGKRLPLGGCTELSHMWQALASEATWPLWDYSPLYNLSFKQRAHLAGLFSRLHEDCILVKDWIKVSM